MNNHNDGWNGMLKQNGWRISHIDPLLIPDDENIEQTLYQNIVDDERNVIIFIFLISAGKLISFTVSIVGASAMCIMFSIQLHNIQSVKFLPPIICLQKPISPRKKEIIMNESKSNQIYCKNER